MPDVWTGETTAERTGVRSGVAGFPAAVVALAAMIDETPHVMVLTSYAVGISDDPPLCSFAVQRTSRTWQQLRRASRLGVTVLGGAHQDRIRQLGSRSTTQRFDGIDWTRTDSGAVLLDGGPVWLECEVVREVPAGDHHLIIAEVVAGDSASTEPPLVHRNRSFLPLHA